MYAHATLMACALRQMYVNVALHRASPRFYSASYCAFTTMLALSMRLLYAYEDHTTFKEMLLRCQCAFTALSLHSSTDAYKTRRFPSF